MKLNIGLAGIAVSLAMSSSSFAQSSDTNYCNALSASYDKYVDPSGGRGRQGPRANVDEAKSKCQSDPASAIPTLEGVLKDNKITLPSRS